MSIKYDLEDRLVDFSCRMIEVVQYYLKQGWGNI